MLVLVFQLITLFEIVVDDQADNVLEVAEFLLNGELVDILRIKILLELLRVRMSYLI